MSFYRELDYQNFVGVGASVESSSFLKSSPIKLSFPVRSSLQFLSVCVWWSWLECWFWFFVFFQFYSSQTRYLMLFCVNIVPLVGKKSWCSLERWINFIVTLYVTHSRLSEPQKLDIKLGKNLLKFKAKQTNSQLGCYLRWQSFGGFAI